MFPHVGSVQSQDSLPDPIGDGNVIVRGHPANEPEPPGVRDEQGDLSPLEEEAAYEHWQVAGVHGHIRSLVGDKPYIHVGRNAMWDSFGGRQLRCCVIWNVEIGSIRGQACTLEQAKDVALALWQKSNGNHAA